jgi:hypothetical protein
MIYHRFRNLKLPTVSLRVLLLLLFLACGGAGTVPPTPGSLPRPRPLPHPPTLRRQPLKPPRCPRR